jgi:cbb3-type cytochrome oxidase cytochrome c subunit
MRIEKDDYVRFFSYPNTNENCSTRLNYVVPKSYAEKFEAMQRTNDNDLSKEEKIESVFLECVSYDNDAIKYAASQLRRLADREDDQDFKEGFRLKAWFLETILEMRILNANKKRSENGNGNGNGN